MASSSFSPLKQKQSSSITQEGFHQLGLEANTILRDYQLVGVNWIIDCHNNNHGCILGDEMGLGKTIQSISYLLYLRSKLSTFAFLVVCPLSLVQNWRKEFETFAPDLKVITLVGDKGSRENTLTKIKHSNTLDSVVITTSEYVLIESDLSLLKWSCIVFDEAHRLKNHESKLHTKLQTKFKINFTLLLTGTPIQNNLLELYSLLSIIHVDAFPLANIDKFVGEYKSIIDKDNKDEISELHSLLKPYLLRRTKEEVLSSLPKCSQVHIYIPISDIQKKIYRAVLYKDLSAFGEAGNKTRLLNVLMQLRKCVNHPYLFNGVEPEPFEMGEHLVTASGKLVILDKILKHLKKTKHKVLLFSQMTHMLDIIQDYLTYRNYTYERLDGSVRGEERYLAINSFNKNEDTFVFLLSTKAGGVGLNLTAADTVIFYDSDFNPQNDIQAAARAHRIGQEKPVKILRLITKNSVEEIIIQRAAKKIEVTDTIIEGGHFALGAGQQDYDKQPLIAEVLKFGLGALLSDESLEEEPIDIERLLGNSHDGMWVDRDSTDIGEKITPDDEITNLYEFEGEDYSKAAKKSDDSAFDVMLQEYISVQTGDKSVLGTRVLRSEEGTQKITKPFELVISKKRVLTPEQLEARRVKREENRAKRQKLLEEKEQLKQEETRKKLLLFWKKNEYTSSNLPLNSELEDSSSGDSEEELLSGLDLSESDTTERICFVKGDVTHPSVKHVGDKNAIVVHCVDNSGKWGHGGVFSALSARSLLPSSVYELAGKMGDLELGHAHFSPIDDLQSRGEGRDFVALIVSQRRDEHGVSGIKLSALDEGLQRVKRIAIKENASVHLPRIGHSTRNFNWYGTERLIQKHLASNGIPTCVYYYSKL
ncbi:Chromodomain-helicase-DNA-binding protein 1-like [Oopsacas minuta]|uniref:Chromodomain-helicase-DNA-binding protein 1-like n=1 Tax=Oopsacas minuta TaxID=111878 RepID=A0AAV7JLC0_9METZ|nr:Chromodomain-helicase-DNA-binding protein 1-like [Oopsacas minuta]